LIFTEDIGSIRVLCMAEGFVLRRESGFGYFIVELHLGNRELRGNLGDIGVFWDFGFSFSLLEGKYRG
jgi:hypothetical protein